jgi:hypothetical protein
LAISDRLFRAGCDNGIIFRAFTDGTIGLAPALSYTEAEMETLLARGCGAPSTTCWKQRIFAQRSECHHKALWPGRGWD